MQEKSPEFWTAIGTAVGAIGMKLIGIFFRRSFSEADQIRKELRERTQFLEEEIKKVYAEVDKWRKKYWEQVEQNNELKTECHSLRLAIEQLKAEREK